MYEWVCFYFALKKFDSFCTTIRLRQSILAAVCWLPYCIHHQQIVVHMYDIMWRAARRSLILKTKAARRPLGRQPATG